MNLFQRYIFGSVLKTMLTIVGGLVFIALLSQGAESDGFDCRKPTNDTHLHLGFSCSQLPNSFLCYCLSHCLSHLLPPSIANIEIAKWSSLRLQHVSLFGCNTGFEVGLLGNHLPARYQSLGSTTGLSGNASHCQRSQIRPCRNTHSSGRVQFTQ